MRGLRESGALSKYRVHISNQSGSPIFVYTLATPFESDWADLDVENYGELGMTQFLVGQSRSIYSEKVFDERLGKQVHPKRYFLVADRAYRGDDPDTISYSSGLSNPGLRGNTIEDLLEEMIELHTTEVSFVVVQRDDGKLTLQQVQPDS